MDTAFIVQIGWGALGGGLVWLVLHSLLSLKLFRLHLALEQIRQQILSLQGSTKARARWDKDEALAQQLLSQPVHKNERFANDPIPWEH